jgi:hypothetical protein
MEITLKDLKELFKSNKLSLQAPEEASEFVGKYVIIRTYSAGVHFGLLAKKDGKEVVLHDARRLYRFFCLKGISLSEVAKYGIVQDKSKICEAVNCIWLEAIEILPCSEEAALSIKGAPNAKQ